MRPWLMFSVFLGSWIFAPGALSQENAPAIIPEQLQLLAREQKIATQLKIDWQKATPQEVGQYIGILATANVLAREIALRNKRFEPSTADFLAGLSLACIWPPNKPPMVAQNWPLFYSSFYNTKLRMLLPQAVGPLAADVANSATPTLPDLNVMTSKISKWPTEQDSYYAQVLDVRKLDTVK